MDLDLIKKEVEKTINSDQLKKESNTREKNEFDARANSLAPELEKNYKNFMNEVTHILKEKGLEHYVCIKGREAVDKLIALKSNFLAEHAGFINYCYSTDTVKEFKDYCADVFSDKFQKQMTRLTDKNALTLKFLDNEKDKNDTVLLTYKVDDVSLFAINANCDISLPKNLQDIDNTFKTEVMSKRDKEYYKNNVQVLDQYEKLNESLKALCEDKEKLEEGVFKAVYNNLENANKILDNPKSISPSRFRLYRLKEHLVSKDDARNPNKWDFATM